MAAKRASKKASRKPASGKVRSGATQHAKGKPKAAQDANLAAQLTSAYLDYGTATIEGRALPDFRDGLTPVQRRLLWTCWEDRLTPDRAYKKAASIVGSAMGYHPHGDLSLAGALVNLAHLPLKMIDGLGNWGRPELGSTVPAAAVRYIEGKLTQDAVDCLFDRRLLAVSDMVPNYDGTKLEPLVLPAALPMPLLLGATGIAVGTTTNIPAFTAKSVAALVGMALGKEKITPAVLAKTLKLASPYGGKVVSTAAEQAAVWDTGRGKVEWVGQWTPDASNRTITLHDLPPDWPYDGALNRMRAVTEVRHVKDLSSGSRIAIEIGFKPSVPKKEFDAFAEKFAKRFFGKTISYRINVTRRLKVEKDGLTETSAKFFEAGVASLINEWIEWRVAFEVKAAQKEKADFEARMRREQLLLRGAQNAEALVKILRSKAAPDKVAASVRKLLACSKDEADWVMDQPLSRLSRVSEEAVAEKIKRLQADVKAAEKIIARPRAAVAASLPTFA